MRLRPFGQTGPLVSSFNALQTYYELHGRAWERYAGLKARALTGETEDVEFLMDNILNPFIYRRYTDFSAMESLRELKHKIQMDVEKKGREANIKLGVGGIREAEFIVQAFQLVYGGRERALQTQSWLRALQVIQEKGFMDSDTAGLLREAYLFLRAVENHLQAWDDQQTQILPEDDVVQQALAQSLGFANYVELMVTLNLHRSVVAEQFSEVFRDPDSEEAENALDDRALSDRKNQTLQEKVSWLLESLEPKSEMEEAQAVALSELGFKPSIQADTYRKLVQFTQSREYRAASAESLNRLVKVLPKLLMAVAQQPNPVLTLERALQVLEAILRRSIYLVLLYENSHAIDSLVRLCSASPWLTEQLARHPALFDQLAQAETLDQLSDAETLKEEAMLIYRQASGDEEHFMDQLRIWRHAQVFKVAVSDLEGLLPVMQVSDRLTWIAEAVLSASCAFAADWCEARYGQPGGEVAYNPFMVVGYGKLGGIELGYGSDLDIVMLYHGVPSNLHSTGKQPLENGLYFLRMGQKVISLLTTPMPSGRLYEVDTRLRPNGASGLIVTDFESYQAYLQNKAWVWEHQAFVRTRPVVAAPENIQAFESFKTAFLTQPRDRAVLCQEISDMLDKMRKSLDRSDEQTFDLKYGAGGVVEIEFLVQYWVLAYASEYEALTHYPDNIRLLETIKSIGLIESEKATALMEIYQDYRTCYHRKALQNEKTLVPVKEFEKERQKVHQIWQEVMNCQKS
jgi:glutamate-ammonia-ligase adenylyltransferase